MISLSAVRKNVSKYEKALDKAELKRISKKIEIASKRGCNILTWHGDIRKNNILKLIKQGYNVEQCNCLYYEIEW